MKFHKLGAYNSWEVKNLSYHGYGGGGWSLDNGDRYWRGGWRGREGGVSVQILDSHELFYCFSALSV